MRARRKGPPADPGRLRGPREIMPFQTEDGSYRLVRRIRTARGVWWRGTVTLRLDLTPEDEKRGFNRTEVLSPTTAPLRTSSTTKGHTLLAT
jgi:hypothetical protein